MASSNRILSLPLIFLIIVILLFYNELIALGMRLYVTLSDNPKAEIFLADYYKARSYLSKNYADSLYVRAFESLKTKAPQGDAEEKANLAKMYQCGFGTTRNIEQAKHWYEQALTQASPNEKNKIQMRITNLNSQHNDMSKNLNNTYEFSNNTVEGCQINYEPHFIVRTWKYFEKIK